MIDLYTSPTANGYRASIMLEETALPYTVHVIDLSSGEQKSAEFLTINPTGRIPAIVDTIDGERVAIAESLAIAAYLAEKSGRLMPRDATSRAQAWQWAALVATGFGAATPGIFFARQLGADDHAKIIAKFFADIQNYLAAMETRLASSEWLAGTEFTFADALAIPTLAVSLPRFGVDLAPFPAVLRWRDACLARPGVTRGMKVPA